ncbi:MAG: hypothetical protein ACKVOQ_23320 [Cyclobacteriaceae bacterium]
MPKKLVTTKALLQELKGLLQKQLPSQQAFVGFDGFIDTIQKAVRQRSSESVSYFSTINDFAVHLQKLNGKSGQIELVTNKIKMGGNAPILSHALGKLGVKTKCLGAMGLPEINPLFKSNDPSIETISVSSPGKSSAIEFDNGKIIFSDLSVFKNYTWKYVKQNIDLVKFKKTIEPCKLFALVDWANLPEATDLWEGFLEDVIKPRGKREQFFFFDLCDPSKKSAQQIDEVLDLISDFSTYGKVTLGINENEAVKIWMALTGHDHSLPNEHVEIPSLQMAGYFIYRAMDIDSLLIHPIDRILVFKDQNKFKKQSVIELKGNVVVDPKVLTGGGDNLNAGYCLGLLAGFEACHCMLLGMAASGAYVQNGESPSVSDIIDYVDKWALKLESSPTGIR